jgi:hypothetical protein
MAIFVDHDLGRWLRQHLEDQPQTERHKETKNAVTEYDYRVDCSVGKRSKEFGSIFRHDANSLCSMHVNHFTSLK